MLHYRLVSAFGSLSLRFVFVMMIDIPALLKRIADGDEAALSALFHHFGSKVYGMAYTVLKNTALAQEVAQDTFMHIWKNPAAWDASKGQFSSWLLTVTRYSAIDRLRREVRRTGQDVELRDEIATDENDDSLIHRLESDDAIRSLAHLPDEQRRVIELAYFQGMKHSEIAEFLHTPLGTVKTRLRLGLHKLRDLLNNQS